MKSIFGNTAYGVLIAAGLASLTIASPAHAAIKQLQLPWDAKNVRIVALKPAQIFKGLKVVKNPDCKTSAAGVPETASLCLNEISQPVYDDGIELTVNYESKTQGPVDGVAKCEAAPASSDVAISPCQRTELMEATIGFERNEFTKEQLAKLDSGLDGDADTAYAKQIIALDLQSTTSTKEVVDPEKSQFCDYAPDDAAPSASSPKCLAKTVTKLVTETTQQVLVSVKK